MINTHGEYQKIGDVVTVFFRIYVTSGYPTATSTFTLMSINNLPYSTGGISSAGISTGILPGQVLCDDNRNTDERVCWCSGNSTTLNFGESGSIGITVTMGSFVNRAFTGSITYLAN